MIISFILTASGNKSYFFGSTRRKLNVSSHVCILIRILFGFDWSFLLGNLDVEESFLLSMTQFPNCLLSPSNIDRQTLISMFYQTAHHNESLLSSPSPASNKKFFNKHSSFNIFKKCFRKFCLIRLEYNC